jgi:hypothetical protein
VNFLTTKVARQSDDRVGRAIAGPKEQIYEIKQSFQHESFMLCIIALEHVSIFNGTT